MNRKQQFDVVNTIVVILLSLVILVLAKNYVTFRHQVNITHAIYGYQLECIQDHREYRIAQNDKEDFFATFWRWWDWSDRNILEYEDYLRIRPYIGWRPK